MKCILQIICLTVLVTSLTPALFSQKPIDNQPPLRSRYEMYIKRMPGKSKTLFGYPGTLTDSSVVLMHPRWWWDRSPEPVEVPVSDIRIIKFSRRNHVTKGILIGGLTAFTTGMVVGVLAGGGSPECRRRNCFIQGSPEGTGLFFGIAAVIPGMVAGGIISNFKIRVPIHGEQAKFERRRSKLLRYGK